MSIALEKYKSIDSNFDKSVWILVPDECPRCHKSILPKKEHLRYTDDNNTLSIIYFCNSCKKLFIASYKDVSKNTKDNPLNFDLYPIEFSKKKFEDAIENAFPSFCEIYNQALNAESMKLDKIAGIGYRKALEYLVKDYVIYINKTHDKNENIKSMPLSQVIEKYIDSEKIKKTAKVASWLGNDETHYLKIYEDKDINDLKKMINAVVAYISIELTYLEVEELTETKKT